MPEKVKRPKKSKTVPPQPEKGGPKTSKSQARKRVHESLKKIGPAYNAQIAEDTRLPPNVVGHAAIELANIRLIANLVSERDFVPARGPLWVHIVGDRQGAHPNDFEDVPELSNDEILTSLRRCLKGASGLWIEWDALKRAVDVAESRLSSQMIKFLQHGDVTRRDIPGHGRNQEYQWLAVPRPNTPDMLKSRPGRTPAPLESYVPPEELHARLTKKDIRAALVTAPPDTVLTTVQLAQWLDTPGVTPRQVERWRRRGEGPLYFLVKTTKGEGVRYAAGDVREWLEGKL